MSELAKLSVDPTAWMAVGFLVSILAISIGLFGWVMAQGGKKPPHA